MQATPYDSLMNVRVWGPIDQFMKLVMEELNIEVPQTEEARDKWLPLDNKSTGWRGLFGM